MLTPEEMSALQAGLETTRRMELKLDALLECNPEGQERYYVILNELAAALEAKGKLDTWLQRGRA